MKIYKGAKILIFTYLLFISFNSIGQEYTAIQELNIRSENNAKSEVIGTIHKGENINILEKKESWGKINYQSKQGYVSLKYLEKLKTTSTENDTASQGMSFNLKLIILALIGIILFLLRNTIVVRGLFKIIVTILNLSKDGATTSNIRNSNSSRNYNTNSPPKQKSEVRCYSCGVRKNDATNICNGKNIPHRWKYM